MSENAEIYIFRKVNSPYLSLSRETTRWTFDDNENYKPHLFFSRKYYTYAHIDRISWNISILDAEMVETMKKFKNWSFGLNIVAEVHEQLGC